MSDWKDVLSINLNAVFQLCQLAGRNMLERGYGKIINMASMLSFFGGFTVPAYAASKGGVLALTKNAARALADRGISVNTVAPGATLTPMIEEAWKNEAHRRRVEAMAVQNRTAAPEEIAKSIAFLLSPDASIVTGATLVADGGLVMY